MKGIACPSCAAPMRSQAFARKPNGQVELELCFDCHGIWFDQYESTSLTPGAVMDLFRLINEHHERPPRPLADAMGCPRCRTRLALTHDIQRTNRITYYRCPEGHGRYTTFFQFLREKNFVRSLTQPEIEQLRVTVAQVRCSSCGAPVSLGSQSACGYCRAPVSILDADAVKRNLAELAAAEARVRNPDPVDVAQARLENKRLERRLQQLDSPELGSVDWVPSAGMVELVGAALFSLFSD